MVHFIQLMNGSRLGLSIVSMLGAKNDYSERCLGSLNTLRSFFDSKKTIIFYLGTLQSSREGNELDLRV